MLALVAMIIAVILALGGLAIDAARLYTDKTALQKACDMGVVAGMRSRIALGYRLAKENPSRIEGAALRTASQNLVLAGLNVPDSSIVMNYSSNQDRVTCSINMRPDLLFMDRVPYFGNRDGVANVSAYASASLSPTYFALLLDLSGSMHCLNSDDCRCLIVGGEESCQQMATPANPQKITLLKQATADFIGKLHPHRDKVAIVPFAARGRILVPFRFMPGFSQVQVETAINSLNVGDGTDNLFIGEGTNTNPSDAMIQLYKHIQESRNSRALDPERLVNYVYITDSAPTAGRFFFSAPDIRSRASDLDQNNPDGFQGVSYDYTLWEIAWRHPDPTVPDYAGPSALVKTQNVIAGPGTDRFTQTGGDEFAWYYTLGGTTIIDRYPARENVADCTNGGDLGNYGFRAAETEAGEEDKFGEMLRKVFNRCLTNLGFVVPSDRPSGFSLGPYADDVGESTSGMDYTGVFNKFGHYRQQFYHVTIVYADLLRAINGRFLVAGVGKSATPEGQTPADPYEFCELCTEPRAPIPTYQYLKYRQYCLHCMQSDFNSNGGACNTYKSTMKSKNCPPYETVFGDYTRSRLRKDVLLTRISGDTDKSMPVDFSFRGYTPWATLRTNLSNSPRKGIYKKLSSYTELSTFFDLVLAQTVRIEE